MASMNYYLILGKLRTACYVLLCWPVHRGVIEPHCDNASQCSSLFPLSKLVSSHRTRGLDGMRQSPVIQSAETCPLVVLVGARNAKEANGIHHDLLEMASVCFGSKQRQV